MQFAYDVGMDGQKLDKRFQIVMAGAQLDAIDDWRVQQRPVPTRSEAIRQLIDYALEMKAREGAKRSAP